MLFLIVLDSEGHKLLLSLTALQAFHGNCICVRQRAACLHELVAVCVDHERLLRSATVGEGKGSS